MTREQIIQLLQIITSYDSRKPSQAMVNSWLDASERGRWNYDDAVESVRDHFTHSADWLMPAHITKGVKELKRERGRYFVPEPPKQLASQETKDRVIAEFRAGRAARLNGK